MVCEVWLLVVLFGGLVVVKVFFDVLFGGLLIGFFYV